MVKILSVVVPASKARAAERCISSPSATGSENGIPNSITPAPASSIARINSLVASKSGSPAVMEGIKTFLFLANAFSMLFM